jgi:hypothetical protein
MSNVPIYRLNAKPISDKERQIEFDRKNTLGFRFGKAFGERVPVINVKGHPIAPTPMTQETIDRMKPILNKTIKDLRYAPGNAPEET